MSKLALAAAVLISLLVLAACGGDSSAPAAGGLAVTCADATATADAACRDGAKPLVLSRPLASAPLAGPSFTCCDPKDPDYWLYAPPTLVFQGDDLPWGGLNPSGSPSGQWVNVTLQVANSGNQEQILWFQGYVFAPDGLEGTGSLCTQCNTPVPAMSEAMVGLGRSYFWPGDHLAVLAIWHDIEIITSPDEGPQTGDPYNPFELVHIQFTVVQ